MEPDGSPHAPAPESLCKKTSSPEKTVKGALVGPVLRFLKTWAGAYAGHRLSVVRALWREEEQEQEDECLAERKVQEDFLEEVIPKLFGRKEGTIQEKGVVERRLSKQRWQRGHRPGHEKDRCSRLEDRPVNKEDNSCPCGLTFSYREADDKHDKWPGIVQKQKRC